MYSCKMYVFIRIKLLMVIFFFMICFVVRVRDVVILTVMMSV